MARVVVERLLAHGVTDIVLSPGSRSTPLALALAAAERMHAVTLHIRVDERSAAFLALGLAKASGRPVATICTSGTAVANLAPAVVEAAYSGIPLIVITADRPPELRNVGANQTIDQVGFFGQQVRTAVDLIAHADDATASGSWRKVTDRVIADAIGIGHSGPGPVQLNIGFREPLVPLASTGEPFDAGAIEIAAPMPIREPINFAVGDIGLSRIPARGVVVVGDVPNRDVAEQAIELADACGWPVVSEPSGNALTGATAVPAAAVLLADEGFLAAHVPEVVITVGRFGISRPIMRLVGAATHHLAVYVAGKDRPDPLHTAAAVLTGVPRPPDDDPLIPMERVDGQWLRSWLVASAAAQARVHDAIDAGLFTGLAVTDACWRAATADDLLFAASSRTVRSLEAAMSARHYPPWVVGNRGSSGIDGLISTAWGMALAHDRRGDGGRTLAVLGDLAFLHDHNGLIAPIAERTPNLTIVVSDNNGGGIFSSLEQGSPEFAVDFERVFGTPHDRDLVAIAAATGHRTETVTTVDELIDALEQPTTGVNIIIAKTADRVAEQQQWSALNTPT